MKTVFCILFILVTAIAYGKGTWEENQAQAEVQSLEYQAKYPDVRSDKIVFKTVTLPDGSLLDLDFRLERPKEGGPFPVVFYVHGGGWGAGSKSAFTHQSFVLAKQGIAGVRLEYRWRKQGAKYPEGISDVMDAIDYVRQRADEFNLDFTRVGLAGGSAGGHLSAIAAQLTPECICYDGYNGLFDAYERNGGRFGGGDYTGTTEQEKKAASALYNIKTPPPDTLLYHGTEDTTIVVKQSYRFAEAIRKKGGSAEVLVYEGVGHSFFNKEPYLTTTTEALLKHTSKVFGIMDTEYAHRSWADRLDYAGVAVEEPDYHVWGSSPVIDSVGKVPLFVARWPLKEEFKAWLTHCEIARYESDTSEGPFVFQDVVVKGSEKEGTWDFQSPHNPHIQKVGDRYVLTYIANAGGVKKEQVASQRIGMMIADRPEGPWKKVGDDGMILAPPKDPSIWSYQSTVGVNNPALFEHADGRFFLYYKAMREGDVRRMGVAIADQLEGPYVFVPESLTSNSTTIEDGYAFSENGKIYLLTTDNHEGTGYLWGSDDGIHFEDPVLGYDRVDQYVDEAYVARSKVLRSKKFERPQLLMQGGHPTHLYVASGVSLNGGEGSHSCFFKIETSRPHSR